MLFAEYSQVIIICESIFVSIPTGVIPRHSIGVRIQGRSNVAIFRHVTFIIQATTIRLHQPVKNLISDKSNILWNSPSLGINSRYRLP